jgi:hypothetical protein
MSAQNTPNMKAWLAGYKAGRYDGVRIVGKMLVNAAPLRHGETMTLEEIGRHVLGSAEQLADLPDFDDSTEPDPAADGNPAHAKCVAVTAKIG